MYCNLFLYLLLLEEPSDHQQLLVPVWHKSEQGRNQTLRCQNIPIHLIRILWEKSRNSFLDIFFGSSVFLGYIMKYQNNQSRKKTALFLPITIVHNSFDKFHNLRHILTDPCENIRREDLSIKDTTGFHHCSDLTSVSTCTLHNTTAQLFSTMIIMWNVSWAPRLLKIL